jgi:SH3-like domain-containing protein
MRTSLKVLFGLMAAMLLILIGVSCAPKVTAKVEAVPMIRVTNTQGIGVNATSDYKRICVLGVLGKGDTAAIEDVYGDYVEVTTTNGKQGWVYVGLFTAAGKGKLECTNIVGASLVDKPYSKTAVSAVTKGTIVSVLQVSATWYQIPFHTGIGWVYKGGVEVWTNYVTNYITNK